MCWLCWACSNLTAVLRPPDPALLPLTCPRGPSSAAHALPHQLLSQRASLTRLSWGLKGSPKIPRAHQFCWLYTWVLIFIKQLPQSIFKILSSFHVFSLWRCFWCDGGSYLMRFWYVSFFGENENILDFTISLFRFYLLGYYIELLILLGNLFLMFWGLVFFVLFGVLMIGLFIWDPWISGNCGFVVWILSNCILTYCLFFNWLSD